MILPINHEVKSARNTSPIISRTKHGLRILTELQCEACRRENVYGHTTCKKQKEMIVLHTLSRLPIPLNLSSASSSSSQIKCKKIYPIFCSALLPSPSKQFHKTRNRTARRRSDFRDGIDPVQESAFFDENGVVQDMDGYLNYLSLEYDSVWDTKPSWCQPWTITLTGIGIILSSWLILHSIVISSLVGALICAWWYIFLYSYPKAYSDMIADRRNNVTSGLEDTYGMKTED